MSPSYQSNGQAETMPKTVLQVICHRYTFWWYVSRVFDVIPKMDHSWNSIGIERCGSLLQFDRQPFFETPNWTERNRKECWAPTKEDVEANQNKKKRCVRDKIKRFFWLVMCQPVSASRVYRSCKTCHLAGMDNVRERKRYAKRWVWKRFALARQQACVLVYIVITNFAFVFKAHLVVDLFCYHSCLCIELSTRIFVLPCIETNWALIPTASHT